MEYYKVLETLAIRAKQIHDSDDEGADDDTRILIAASVGILSDFVSHLEAVHGKENRRFDFDNELHKAFLLRAVSRLNPDAELDEEEKEVIALLGEYVE